MRLLKATICLCLFFSFAIVAQAQSGKLEKANKLYDQLAYAEAIKVYKQVLEKKEEPIAVIRIANSYRLLNEPDNAANWYKKVMDLDERQPIHTLYYAQSLMQIEHYEEAKIWFEKYDELNPSDKRGYYGFTAIENLEKLKGGQELFSIDNLPFNSARSDFGPAFYNEGIVFASDRDARKHTERIFDWTGTPFLNIFEVKKEGEGKWEEPDLFEGVANTQYHDGPVTFSSDFKTMYFTRNNYEEGAFGGSVEKNTEDVVLLKIMQANLEDAKKGDWEDAQNLPFISDQYSTAHPSLSYDGQRLYFASDMPGGYGGTDIYVVEKNGDSWGAPKNLGDKINTEGEEMFPFIAKDSTLYFSSNALPGLGGLDIFRADYDPEDDEFVNVINLEAPLNSSRDDFAFIIKDDNSSGYFTSNRPGGKGNDDIYAFNSLMIYLEIQVVDAETEEPLKNAFVNLSDTKKSIARDTTDEDGMVYMVVKRNENFAILGSKPTYFDNVKNFNTKGMRGGEKKTVVIPLDRAIQVRLVGTVYEKGLSVPIDNATVKLINRNSANVKEIVTGTDGYYEFSLIVDAEYTLDGSKPKYVPDQQRFNTEGITQTKTIKRDLYLEPLYGPGPDGGPVSVVLENIYYDFDKSTIREDASTDLQRLLRMMRDNPRMRIEIGSHTDSRGSYAYNEALSQRRAQAVVDWLIRSGISSNRLVAKGYGEYKLRNECSDGVPCSEVQHQRNRRSEFTVLDFDGDPIAESKERYTENRDYYVPGGYYPGDPNYVKPQTDRQPGSEAIPVVRPDDPSFDKEVDAPHQIIIDNNSGASTQPGKQNPNDPVKTDTEYDMFQDEAETGSNDPLNTNEDVYSQFEEDDENTTSKEDNKPGQSGVSVDEMTSNDDNSRVNQKVDESNLNQGKDANQEAGLTYKIQFAAKTHNNLDYSNIKDLGNVNVESTGSYYRYTIGEFTTRQDAKEFLFEVWERGYESAFVVKYKNGERQ